MEQKMKIHSEFVFDSAHHLEDYNGKCSNLHGHTWKVEIDLKLDLRTAQRIMSKGNGIVWDFTNIKPIKELLDHHYLNEILQGLNPTAENLAIFIKNEVRKTLSFGCILNITVYETSIGKTTYVKVSEPVEGVQ